jgi:hypothetical protein
MPPAGDPAGPARGVLSAAVRLGIVGSYEARRLQRGCARPNTSPWVRRLQAATWRRPHR